MKYLYSLMLVAASLTFVACDDDDNNESNSLPNGALPSEEFTLGNFGDDTYAESIMIESEDEKNAPFISLELLGDGHYLLHSYNTKYAPTKSRRLKKTPLSPYATYSTNGYEYGQYTKNGNVYTLGNGWKVDISEINSRLIKYISDTGFTETFAGGIKETENNIETNTLCRPWLMKTTEEWGFMNNIYVAYIKWYKEDGEWKNTFKAIAGLDDNDFLEKDDIMERIMFSQNGTYLCQYTDGEIDLGTWNWVSRSEGIYHYQWIDDTDNNDVTVRFKGKQMRMYEDGYEHESGMTEHLHVVYTLTAE